MATMLDYERLVQRVAYLSVENAKLKGHHRNGEDQRWNIITIKNCLFNKCTHHSRIITYHLTLL